MAPVYWKVCATAVVPIVYFCFDSTYLEQELYPVEVLVPTPQRVCFM